MSRQNGRHFADKILNAYASKKMFHFYWNFIEIHSWGSIPHYVGIAQDNGSVPSRQQAITWGNVDQEVWYFMASLGCNDFYSLAPLLMCFLKM